MKILLAILWALFSVAAFAQITSYQVMSASSTGTLVDYYDNNGFSLALNLPPALDGSGNVLTGTNLTNFITSYAPVTQETAFENNANANLTGLVTGQTITFSLPLTASAVTSAQSATVTTLKPATP